MKNKWVYFSIALILLSAIKGSPGILNQQEEAIYSYFFDFPEILTDYEQINRLTNKTPKVVIIDTGVDLTHPFLVSSNITEYNLYQEILTQSNQHGTKVACIIKSNSTLLKGVAYGVELISIRVGADNGWPVEYLEKGIETALSLKPDVINISASTSIDSENLQRLINTAVASNIVLVASAGNDSSSRAINYPAAYPGVISVGAIDINYNLTNITNYGTSVDIFAPGEDILTCQTGAVDVTTRFNGTSAAAPFVTALAAILKSINESLTVKQVENIIIQNSWPVKRNNDVIRIVDYNKSISSLLNKK